MWIRTNKSRGKIYYQLMDGQGKDRKIIAHLGSAGKIYDIFQFWVKYKDEISDLKKIKNQFQHTGLFSDDKNEKSLKNKDPVKYRVSDEKSD